jgi:hypothetical protein
MIYEAEHRAVHLSNFDIDIVPHIDPKCLCDSDPDLGFLDLYCFEYYQDSLDFPIPEDWDTTGILFKQELKLEAIENIKRRKRQKTEPRLDLWAEIKLDAIRDQERLEQEKREREKAAREAELKRLEEQQAAAEIEKSKQLLAEIRQLEREEEEASRASFARLTEMTKVKRNDKDEVVAKIPVPGFSRVINSYFESRRFYLRDDSRLQYHVQRVTGLVHRLNKLRRELDLSTMAVDTFFDWVPAEYSDLTYETVYRREEIPKNQFAYMTRKINHWYQNTEGFYWYMPKNSGSKAIEIRKEMDYLLEQFADLPSLETLIRQELGYTGKWINWHHGLKKLGRTKLKVITRINSLGEIAYIIQSRFPYWINTEALGKNIVPEDHAGDLHVIN